MPEIRIRDTVTRHQHQLLSDYEPSLTSLFQQTTRFPLDPTPVLVKLWPPLKPRALLPHPSNGCP